MYSWQLPNFKLIPYGGMYFEYLGTDKKYRIIQSDSRGNGTFFSKCCEMLIRSVSIGVNALQPIKQHYAQGKTRAKIRLNAQISFLV